MIARYNTPDGHQIECDVPNVKQCFEMLASCAAAFATEPCGLCGCEEVSREVRHPKGFTYYELWCQNPDCRARFQFGQKQEGGGLFPKRRDENGQALPNNGWTRFEPEQPARKKTRKPAEEELIEDETPF